MKTIFTIDYIITIFLMDRGKTKLNLWLVALVSVLLLPNCKSGGAGFDYSYVGLDSLLLEDYKDIPVQVGFYGDNKFSYKSNVGNYIIKGEINDTGSYSRIELNEYEYVNHKHIGGDTFLVVSMHNDFMFISLIKSNNVVMSDSFYMIRRLGNDTLVVEFEWLYSRLIFDKIDRAVILPVHSYSDWRTKKHFGTSIFAKYYIDKQRLEMCNITYPSVFLRKNVGICTNKYAIWNSEKRKVIVGFEGSENFVAYDWVSNSSLEVKQNQTGYRELTNFKIEQCDNFDLMTNHQNNNYYYSALFNLTNGSFGRVGIFPLTSENKGNIGKRELLIYNERMKLVNKVPLKGNEQFVEFFYWKDCIYAPVINGNNSNGKIYFNLFKRQ